MSRRSASTFSRGLLCAALMAELRRAGRARRRRRPLLIIISRGRLRRALHTVMVGTVCRISLLFFTPTFLARVWALTFYGSCQGTISFVKNGRLYVYGSQAFFFCWSRALGGGRKGSFGRLPLYVSRFSSCRVAGLFVGDVYLITKEGRISCRKVIIYFHLYS